MVDSESFLALVYRIRPRVLWESDLKTAIKPPTEFLKYSTMKERPISFLVPGPIKDPVLAAEVIRLSWKENRTNFLDYTPEFIQSLLEYPGDGPVLAPAFYDDGKIVAFVMGFPRTVRLNGEVRRLLLMTFFTVAPAYKGKGIGKAIWAECLNEARQAGYEGALHYCVDGEASNSITVRSACSAGFEARRVFTVGFMMRPLQSGAERLHEVTTASGETFLNAAASLRTEVPMHRIWSAAEAQWQFQRPGAVCAINPNGGVLTGYVVRGSDAARSSYFFIDDILWDRLSLKERTEMVTEITLRAAESASMAVLPILKYADLSPFVAAGFRRVPRMVHAYLTLWTGTLDGTELPGLYIDVL